MKEIAKKIRHFLYGYDIPFVEKGRNIDYLNEKVDDDIEFEAEIDYTGYSKCNYKIHSIKIKKVYYKLIGVSDEELKQINQNI